MKLYQDLEKRGLVKQVTDPAVEKILNEGQVTFYIGFDPTADTLHVGSMLPLLTMRRLQLAGHRPIAVVGGATGMIGDPSGKSQERNLLSDEVLDQNVEGIRKTIGRFLDFDGPNGAKVVNNADWFKGTSYIDFLRDVGKHFTVNHMVAKESVRSRLEDRDQGISYTEFSYMLLQAYDFLVLNEQEDCSLQVGGSDQWGNVTAGIELIRRIRAAQPENYAKKNEVFGLTHPLVMKADGQKFGKTESGTIWLDSKRTSPYALYQYFVNVADADVIQLLRYFSFQDHETIDALEEQVQNAPEKREAQLSLAREMTRLIHSEAALDQAEKATAALFGKGSLTDLDGATLLDVFGGAPQSQIQKDRLQSGLPLIDALAESKVCQSKGAARKDIKGGGIYLNNSRVTDIEAQIEAKDLIGDTYVVLRKGKKNYHLLTFHE